MEASKKRNTAQSELLAGLIDKLKETKEVDGSSLFDHVALAYGSNIRSIHYLDNRPTVLTGDGADLKLAQHLVRERCISGRLFALITLGLFPGIF